MFETLAIRDLRVYSDAAGGDVRHYLDRNGLECDAVVSDEDGNYGLVEIKLGGAELIEKGVDSLGRLAGKIDTARMKPPAFRMVLTAVGDYAYKHEDGVIVCPISALRPGEAASEEAGMKGWRGHAADVFAEQGSIAAK